MSLSLKNNYHQIVPVSSFDRHNKNEQHTWYLPIEKYLEINIDGYNSIQTTASPVDLKELIIGTLITQGIVDHANAISGINFQHLTEEKMIANVTLQKETRRKGHQPPTALPPPFLQISTEILLKGVANFNKQKKLASNMFSLHSAASIDLKGNIINYRIDVARHNAMDKIIGTLALDSYYDPQNCFIVISSRAAFEIVQKASIIKLKNLIFMSAPTTLAVNKAREYDINIYTYHNNQLFKF
jgi:FdhD protein